MDWLVTVGLALIVGAAIRVRALDKAAAYLLYAAGGIALLQSCLCDTLRDALDGSGGNALDGPIGGSLSAVAGLVQLVVVVLMLVGLARAARAVPPEAT